MIQPHLLLIGGPNGSGKSTVFPALQNTSNDSFVFAPRKIKNENFINADNIAVEHSIGDIAAGRKTIQKIKNMIARNEDIAIETTFSGKTILRYIESAKANNYRIYIVFMSLRSSELSMNRVSQRALLGKHYISMKQIMNRYDRSLNNFFNTYKDLADFWVAADNSTLNIEILYWGGNAFAKHEKIYSHSMGKNYLTQHIDSSRISTDDRISPAFYKLVKARVFEEIRNRPKGNYVSVQNEDGKIEFVKPV
tara:strand:+ start:822 stop:1574 length:753 start_codon:yes stop_codon:yes gene_type:complete